MGFGTLLVCPYEKGARIKDHLARIMRWRGKTKGTGREKIGWSVLRMRLSLQNKKTWYYSEILTKRSMPILLSKKKSRPHGETQLLGRARGSLEVEARRENMGLHLE